MNKNIQSTNIIKKQNAFLKYNFVNFDVNTYLVMTTTLTATMLLLCYHFLRAYYVPGTILKTSHRWFYLIIRSILIWGVS